jgi:hypothetical protein
LFVLEEPSSGMVWTKARSSGQKKLEGSLALNTLVSDRVHFRPSPVGPELFPNTVSNVDHTAGCGLLKSKGRAKSVFFRTKWVRLGVLRASRKGEQRPLPAKKGPRTQDQVSK